MATSGWSAQSMKGQLWWLLEQGKGLVQKHKNWLIPTVAAVYALHKLKPLCNERHEITSSKYFKVLGLNRLDEESRCPDPSLFPQYMVNREGLWIRKFEWPVPDPKGLVFIVHGYGEHMGRYEHVARLLNAAGYAVYGIDHQGHGQSDGDRVYVRQFHDLVDDYIMFVSLIQQQYQRLLQSEYVPTGSSMSESELLSVTLPSFLLGHSMGGLVALHVAFECQQQQAQERQSTTGLEGSDLSTEGKTHSRKEQTERRHIPRVWPWAGVVLSGPAIIPSPEKATPFNVAAAKLFSRFFPKLGLDSIPNGMVARDPAVVARYDIDPLVNRLPMRVRYASELLTAMEEVKSIAPQFQLPLLLLHGESDRLCEVGGSHYFYAQAGSQDKSIRVYGPCYHEIFNEPERQEVLADMLRWLEQRTYRE